MNYPVIDSVLVNLGPLAIRWYGLMYVLGFASFYLLGKWRIGRRLAPWTAQELADLLFYGVVGVVAGGRIGFVLFYGFDHFLRDPLWLVRIWEGGMSFHGGLIGVVVALAVFARKTRRSLLEVADLVTPLVPLGIGLGRIGNFINAELPGRVTELPIGMHFPCASVRNLNMTCFGEYEEVARHVSSLYQVVTDGLAVFVIVWLFAAKPRATGQVAGVFLLASGALRLFSEFFREPDPDKGFIAFDWLTMGQLLSLPTMVAGVVLLFAVRIWPRIGAPAPAHARDKP